MTKAFQTINMLFVPELEHEEQPKLIAVVPNALLVPVQKLGNEIPLQIASLHASFGKQNVA